MKYVLIALILMIVGCTSSNDGELKQAKSDLRFTSEQLQTCQSQLEVYRSSNSGSLNYESQEETPSEPAEPEYETVNVYEVDGTKCYKTDEEGSVPSCGRSFWECKDGVVRECLSNVKYKIKEEQKLVE